MVDKKKLKEAIAKALEDKEKRKFLQSVELIINTRAINFSKSENRLNVDVLLPKGKGGKELKVAVIAEEEIGAQAKKAGADLMILPADIPSYAEKEKLRDLADNYTLLAQPNLMGQVAKSLGQYLGPRGKLPKPITGNPAGMVERAKKTVRIVTKGKYLPVLQVFVGTEKMSEEDLVDNMEAVFDTIRSKVPDSNIKSIYVKLTMGKPIKAM